MLLRMVLMLPPMKIRTAMTTMAMSDRIKGVLSQALSFFALQRETRHCWPPFDDAPGFG